ncbi:Cell division cycle-associated 7 protein [Spatholobus suberectus]|nr:Cell division cycle-associated 7 protein [Spatholobus suberectus]
MLALASVSNSNMELGFSAAQQQQQQNLNEGAASGEKSKRSNSRGVRIVGNRIYDSANGKTCHQCRQKTRDFAAACKNLKKGKPCPIKFCHKCLLNRYGENAEEVAQLDDWTCPKCRGFCNCSFCQKKRGQLPTGPLFHTAKASGFKSVSEMLGAKAATSKDLELNKVNDAAVLPSKEATVEQEQKRVDNSSSDEVLMSKAASPIKQIASDKELVVLLSGELGKENSTDGNSGLKLDPLNVQKTSLPKKSKKTKREELKEISNGDIVDSARKKKSLKRPKICKEVPSEEARGNANDDTKVCNEVSEKETNVDSNHDIACVLMDGPQAWGANDFCLDINKLFGKDAKGRPVSGVQTQVHRNRYTIFGDPANDFIGPVTLAPKDYFFNSKYHDMKHMHGENWNNTVLINGDGDGDGHNAGAKFEAGISRLPNVGMNLEIEKIEEEIPLPPGTELTEILDIEFPPEDVGKALQLLEFCRVFGKALDLKKGEAEAILRELVRKQNLRRGQNTLVVQFQIRVLTLILVDSGNESPSLTTSDGSNSWLKPLEDLITESDLVLKDFPLDWLQEGISGYYNLDLSKKLTLLNFLCDEALGTEKLRTCIDEQNSRHAEEVKEAKSKVAAAKEKEKGLKQKLQNEIAKAVITPNEAPLSIEEHDALLTKIKSEAAQAHAEMLELKGTIPKGKHSSDATRIEPEFLDNNGQAFWKLKSYNGECAVLLQDIKIQDETATAPVEKWFVYGAEKKEEVDKYISSRAKKLKSHNKVSYMLLQ